MVTNIVTKLQTHQQIQTSENDTLPEGGDKQTYLRQ